MSSFEFSVVAIRISLGTLRFATVEVQLIIANYSYMAEGFSFFFQQFVCHLTLFIRTLLTQ